MSVSDNFDYSIPTLKKNNTMYLSVINSQDAKIRPFKKLCTQRDWSTNLYNLDIESSMPRTFGIFTNKVDFINKIDDIEKSNPKILHYPLNKPEYNLSNKDIEKSSPHSNQFKSTRNTNPLKPEYKLSKLEEYPPEIPRFIRDSIDVRDIQGESLLKKYLKGKNNKVKKINIEGSKPRIPYYRKNLGKIKYHYLDYSDLNSNIFKTKRNTNTLDPIYIFNNKDKEKLNFYGHIEKSKPLTQYPYYYKPPLNLKLDDIKGCNPGSKNYINKFNGKNFQIYISDIEKSGVGSLKKGIITKRCLNPLMPKYQYPGEKDLEESINNKHKIVSSQSCLNINTKNLSNEIINVNEQTNINNSLNNNENLSIKKENNKIKEKPLKKSNSMSYCFNARNDDNNNKINNINILNRTPLLKIKNKEINNTFQFDSPKYYKKPYPFYGFSHDTFLQSSENKHHLEEIEKKKQEKEIKKKTYSRNKYENNKGYILKEYIKNPNENNLLFMSDHEIYQSRYSSFNKNNENGVTFLNNSNNLNNNNQYGTNKKSYEEQLELYINNNK